MNPNVMIGAFAVVIAPVVIATEFAANAKEKVRSVIVDAKDELHNRRHFDKKHNYTRRSKR